MKKVIALFLVWMLIGIVVAKAQNSTDIVKSNDAIFPEQYIEEQVLFAKWGKGKGEMGLWRAEKSTSVPQEFQVYSKPAGPDCIQVDDKGNIYILDYHNRRIQKYNGKGQYLLDVYFKNFLDYQKYNRNDQQLRDVNFGILIRIDFFYVSPWTEEIFVYGSNTNFTAGLIQQYDKKGELIRTYQGPQNLSGIYVEDNWIYRINNEPICKLDGSMPDIKTPQKQKPHLSRHSRKFVAEKIVEIDVSPFKHHFNNYKKEKIKIKLPKEAYLGLHVHNDEKGHIYLFCQSGDKLNRDSDCYKYDKEGNLLSVIPFRKNYWTSVSAPWLYFTFDNNENIYQLWTQEEGVYVFRRSKKK